MFSCIEKEPDYRMKQSWKNLKGIYAVRPNYTLLKSGEALDKREKGSAVSHDLEKAFDTICLHFLLQKPKAYKVLGSLLEVNPVYVYW